MNAAIQGMGDAQGLEPITLLRHPQVALGATVTVDKTDYGPAISSLHMAPAMMVKEVYRLARAMRLFKRLTQPG